MFSIADCFVFQYLDLSNLKIRSDCVVGTKISATFKWLMARSPLWTGKGREGKRWKGKQRKSILFLFLFVSMESWNEFSTFHPASDPSQHSLTTLNEFIQENGSVVQPCSNVYTTYLWLKPPQLSNANAAELVWKFLSKSVPPSVYFSFFSFHSSQLLRMVGTAYIVCASVAKPVRPTKVFSPMRWIFTLFFATVCKEKPQGKNRRLREISCCLQKFPAPTTFCLKFEDIIILSGTLLCIFTL